MALLCLMLLQDIPKFTDAVESVQRIGFGNTVGLILVIGFIIWILAEQRSSKELMRDMSKGYVDGAVAQGKTFIALEHHEIKLDVMLRSQSEQTSKLDRLLDRRRDT